MGIDLSVMTCVRGIRCVVLESCAVKVDMLWVGNDGKGGEGWERESWEGWERESWEGWEVDESGKSWH